MTTARWQQLMKQAHGIGVLATIENGEPRLRPMEFSLVDGELWAATAKHSRKYTDVPDGQHVEVLFMNNEFDHARIRGVLRWSTTPHDRERLWQLQHDDITHWYSGVDDPDLVIMRIVPEEAEYKSAHGNDQYWREAA
ncbi:MAG TPA: pyridoxamine 5'-phosphate oxidase family protein [Armatimonadota bacterium]|nr:pyridoxamine 5'-phosphate oxidase family protein [Armatimonadota bacterium]